MGWYGQGRGTLAIVLTAPVIVTTSLPDATQNGAYSFNLSAVHGQPPYTWNLISGQDGNGFPALSSSGALSGTPLSAETLSLVVQVTDSLNTPSAPVSLTLTVDPRAGQFDYYISPTGDDVLNPGTLASPWSLNAFNNSTCRAKYAGKRVGLLPGNGIYSSFTSNGVTTTIHDAMQVTNAWGIFQIQGGVSSSAPTYVGMCNAAGTYSPLSSVIDCADPNTGAYPTQGSSFMGQMFDGSSSSPLPTNLGYVTIDGLHIRHFNYNAISFSHRTAELPGIIVQNCWVHDNWGTVRGGNPGALHFNGATGALIYNNKVHGLRTAWRQPLPTVTQWQNASGTALSNSVGATKAVLASPWPYQTVTIDSSHQSQGFINFSDGESGNNAILPVAGMFVNATYGSTLIDWGTGSTGTPALTGNVSNTIQFSGINGPYLMAAIMFIGQFEDTRAGNYTIKNNTFYDCGGEVIHQKDHLCTGICEFSYNYLVMGTMGVDDAGYAQTSDALDGLTFSGAAPGATLNIHHNLLATQARNIGDAGVGTISARNLGTVNFYNNTLCAGQSSVDAFETGGDAANPTGQFNCYDNLCWNPEGNTAGVGRWGYTQPTLSTPGFGTRVGNNVYNSGATFYVTNGTASVPAYSLAQMQAGASGTVVEQGSINYASNPFANGTGPLPSTVDGGLLLSSWAISSAAQTAMLAMPDGIVCGAVDENGNVVGGGTIGCNFSTAPTGQFLGLSMQGLSLATTGSGSGSTFQNFTGTDTKWGDTFPLYPASPWGGTANFTDGIQIIYSGATYTSDITNAIATDNTVPYGVSSSVCVQSLISPSSGDQQNSYIVHPSISNTQGMLYQSMWFWLQADMTSRGPDFEQEFVEFKTPDGTGSFLGPERFQVLIFQANNSHGYSTTLPNFVFTHNTEVSNGSGLYTFMTASLAPNSSFTSKNYTAGFTKPYVGVPLGRWAKLEWAFNRSDASGNGWMWVALTDPGSTDPDLVRGITIFQTRGAFSFTDPDGSGTWTNGMNIPSAPIGGVNPPGAFINRLFLCNLSYGGITRSSSSPYVIKFTDVQVYTSWPSNATAHPSNYM